MNDPIIVVIDDDPGILRIIKLDLSDQGFQVLIATNGQQGLELITQHHPDLIVLDILMPDMNGLEVLRQLREWSNIPVIFLSAKKSEADRVRGLELGADDYVTKPFSLDELAARVRAVLRRTKLIEKIQNHEIVAGDVTIDLARRTVKKHDVIVILSRMEWNLLQVLAANANKVMLNAELLSKVWGPEYIGDLQYLRVWISRLRAKIETDQANPKIVITFPGVGYMLKSNEAN